MARKVKTRDRILKTALALFNEEGEAQVSTVEIAGVLDISPGNLYYHFKGKEAIIEALFDDFEEEIRQVLSAPIKRALSIEDNWIYIYIVFEEINDFRFFYNNLTGILERCPDLRPRFARILRLKEETAASILSALAGEGAIECSGAERAALAARFAAHLTFWLQFVSLAGEKGDNSSVINNGVHSTMMMIAPYVPGDDRALFAEMLKKQTATLK